MPAEYRPYLLDHAVVGRISAIGATTERSAPVNENAQFETTVTVDGAPAKLLRADYAFRGVALPAGRHRVEMRFRSRPTEIGIKLSLAGLALVLGLALARRRT